MHLLIGFVGRCVALILLEGPFTPFALVVFLGGSPSDQLHALGNDTLVGVFHQEMNAGNALILCEYFSRSTCCVDPTQNRSKPLSDPKQPE